MLLVMVVSAVVLNADCDMAAMIAKTGFSISTIGMGTGDYDDPDEFIDFLINHSTGGTNPDGYGVTYIDEDGNFPYINTTNLVTEFYSSQAWYVTAQDINANTYYYDYVHNGNHYYTGPMEAARDAIKLDDNNVAIVLGHDRRSSTALGNHPFRFDYDANTKFQFMHNGGIDDDIKLALYNELGGASWFATNNHPSNWNTSYTQYNQFIDSEILFHWIMSNIINNDGDVLSGIHDALTATIDDGEIDLEYEFRNPVATLHNVVNFILTDGETLYAFRNALNSWSHHYLSWEENDNNSYTVKTQSELENSLNQFDLVKISRDEDPIVYNNFFDLDVKVFASGYNWISFPRLTEQGITPAPEEYLYEQAYYEGGLPGILQLASGGDPTIAGFDIIYGHRLDEDYDMDIAYYDGNFIDGGFDNMFFRHEGYKVKVESGEEPTVLVVDGERLPTDYELSDEILEANVYHWLGYWLPYSQDIDDAFGDFWQYVKIVKAENWTWMDMNNPRGEPVPSMKIRPLEYGKAYLVKFTEDINDFQWNDSGSSEEPEEREDPENFTFEEKADYEVIDILEIEPNVTEIGVFEDGNCVGAVTVQDSAEQILVYSTSVNRNPVPFTFEIVAGRGFSSPIKDYLVLNQANGKFEPSVIFSGQQDYSAIKFGVQEEPENIISRSVLNGNYPNPFNPTTTISFSLPNEQEIELSIYNIKGQQVKTLYSGIADEGEHTIIWSGKDLNDKTVSSGIYFYKLKTNNKELTRKMLLMK